MSSEKGGQTWLRVSRFFNKHFDWKILKKKKRSKKVWRGDRQARMPIKKLDEKHLSCNWEFG